MHLAYMFLLLSTGHTDEPCYSLRDYVCAVPDHAAHVALHIDFDTMEECQAAALAYKVAPRVLQADCRPEHKHDFPGYDRSNDPNYDPDADDP